MGVDAWTRTEHEQKWRARAQKHEAEKGKTFGQKARDAANDLRNGTRRCACGCGKEGTYFRDRKLYNKACVGRGSGWDKSGLPQDRTPPMSRQRRREINRTTRG